MEIKYPEYYVVDFDVFIKMEKVGEDIVATNHLGNPYSIGKAIVDGQRTTEAEFLKAQKRAQAAKTTD